MKNLSEEGRAGWGVDHPIEQQSGWPVPTIQLHRQSESLQKLAGDSPLTFKKKKNIGKLRRLSKSELICNCAAICLIVFHFGPKKI